ncbi:alpha/beta hydrolase family protein [Bacillus mesophilum]|uniref:Alpha/beta fold hydrolase n=1 Tax=Bacillus mesophilum TaxID=1071718 RepID=A0A7V7RJ26_9BACI|nr:alpha/beta fold hydrolase [Bacillus mesophilum]KAB2330641.1 alpha/beta fold hydrolase [Bacillus mesophilum]
MIRHISIQWEDRKLAAAIHYPDLYGKENKKYPVIVICHGFVGSKVGINRLFVKASQELSLEECVIVRFDYAGCGESEGDYGQSCIDDWILQTKSIINYSLEIEHIDREQLVLIGHSLGGAVALLTATQDQRIKRLVLWSAVGQPFKDITSIVGEERLEVLKESGEFDYQGYYLREKFIESLKKYHPLKLVSKFNGDVLLIHGSADEEISVNHCYNYYYAFRTRKQGICDKRIINGANHTFSSAATYKQLIHETKLWIGQRHTLVI